MEPLGNDRWAGRFALEENTRYVYTLEAWPDAYRSWAEDLRKRLSAGMDVASELLEGAVLLRGALARVMGADRRRLEARLAEFEGTGDARPPRAPAAQRGGRGDPRHLPRPRGGDGIRPGAGGGRGPPLARFAAWYELFPRSQGRVPGRHGTFRDCIERLPDIAAMGFDVVYLPPIHPIGRSFRKGRNNALEAGADDPGSPWAIGNEHGGHKAIEPALGTLADFRAFLRAAPGSRARDRARLRASVLARSPLGDGASRVVPPPSGRDASSTPRTRRRSTRTSTL